MSSEEIAEGTQENVDQLLEGIDHGRLLGLILTGGEFHGALLAEGDLHIGEVGLIEGKAFRNEGLGRSADLVGGEGVALADNAVGRELTGDAVDDDRQLGVGIGDLGLRGREDRGAA